MVRQVDRRQERGGQTDYGCVSTPSQSRDSEAGFEIRVFTTLILKKILASCRDRTHVQKQCLIRLEAYALTICATETVAQCSEIIFSKLN